MTSALTFEVRPVMNIREAAAYLGISPDTLYRYIGSKKVPAFKLGNRWRFRKTALDAWMERLTIVQLKKGASA